VIGSGAKEGEMAVKDMSLEAHVSCGPRNPKYTLLKRTNVKEGTFGWKQGNDDLIKQIRASEAVSRQGKN
jgi:hypothetical protein